MGVLRVYLALCVVHGHAFQAIVPWHMHWGYQAVEMFYLVSGFYMAMVLSSKRYAAPRDFYLSRFLRVFLPYWIVLGAVVIWCAGFGLITHNWLSLEPYFNGQLKENGMVGVLLTALTNVTLVGQDWVMFLQQDQGQALVFTPDFSIDAAPLWHYLAVPPCWSIGVEVTFYLLAPFINRLRSRWLVGIALVSTMLRFVGYAYFGPIDPWIYRFFPFEITLFLCGMLAYRILPLIPGWLRPPAVVTSRAYVVAAAGLLAVLAIHVHVAELARAWWGDGAGLLLTNAMWAAALPAIFLMFGNFTWDRLLGELSYPIYLVHMIVIATVQATGLQTFRLVGVASAVISILLALALYLFVIVPLDRRRHVLTLAKPAEAETLENVPPSVVAPTALSLTA